LICGAEGPSYEDRRFSCRFGDDLRAQRGLCARDFLLSHESRVVPDALCGLSRQPGQLFPLVLRGRAQISAQTFAQSRQIPELAFEVATEVLRLPPRRRTCLERFAEAPCAGVKEVANGGAQVADCEEYQQPEVGCRPDEVA